MCSNGTCHSAVLISVTYIYSIYLIRLPNRICIKYIYYIFLYETFPRFIFFYPSAVRLVLVHKWFNFHEINNYTVHVEKDRRFSLIISICLQLIVLFLFLKDLTHGRTDRQAEKSYLYVIQICLTAMELQI